MSWAGAVMRWAGAVMIFGRGMLNFKLSYSKNAQKCQKKLSVIDGRTDERTDTLTYRSRSPRQKH